MLNRRSRSGIFRELSLWILGTLALSPLPARAQETVRREWRVDGVNRTGLLFIPPAAKKTPPPVLFVFEERLREERGIQYLKDSPVRILARG